MPSISLAHWQTDRRDALEELEAAHAKMGGVGPGRRYATQLINQAYAMVLSTQFQGFCRDLHSEAVDHVCHQDFTSKELDGRTTVTLAMVRKWRGTCEALAMDLDSVVGSRLAIILGANPW
jgi:hypothetical protein